MTTIAQFTGALKTVGITPAAVVLNRALPEELAGELAPLNLDLLSPEEVAVVRFVRGTAAIQGRLLHSLRATVPVVKVIPAARGLDGDDRLSALAQLGASLLPRPSHLP